MPGGVKMFCGVAIGRGVAASDVSARLAQSQVHPGGTDLQTILAAVGTGSDVLANLIKVRAGLSSHDSTVLATETTPLCAAAARLTRERPIRFLSAVEYSGGAWRGTSPKKGEAS